MAAEEARAMLDALMGGDRNAPLPPGAAMPRSKKKRKHDNGGDMLLLPGKRSKSCFDPDIDPLYCAWGVDVYELFVNTKSDIGPNPYVADEGARQEFLQLPPAEQERLGFFYFLFQKLQELVRSGDRTVARNKEKLAQELRRLAAKRGANPQQQQPVVDYVQDVDEQAVEALARNQLELEFLQKRLQDELLVELEEMQEQEDDLKKELSALLDELRENDVAKKKEQESTAEENDGDAKDTEKNGEDVEVEQTKVKEEESTGGETAIKEEPDENGSQDVKMKEDESSEKNVKQEEEASNADVPIKTEPNEEESGQATTTTPTEEKNPRIQELQTQLGKLTLKKQRVLWETARTVSQVAPLQEAMDGQLRNLLYVKSDIAADKTVCEVSGNFMSARDADERIAAHYAGKQYVGWKLVREKFKEMIAKYGRYGPPPPDRANRGGGGGGGPPPVMGMHNQHHRGGGGGPPPPRSNSGGNSGGGYGRGGGDRYGGGGGGGGGGFDRGGGGRGRGGGGWGDRGGGDRGRWERHGPGGPPGFGGGRGFRR